MSLKDISILELWWAFCSAEQNHWCDFGRGYYEEQFCENYFEFGPVVRVDMSFKDISYLELWQPFCSAERNHLCNFGRVYTEEQFCEIILNLGKWFRRFHLRFLI